MSKKAIICDLDGCLFDDSHRKHLIGSPKEKPYARYHSQHLQDIAIEHTLKTIQHYIELGAMVIFITGRSSGYFGSTTLQIEKYIGHDQYLLFMRHELDEESSSPDLKKTILHRLLRDFEIIAAYDDRWDVVDMYRDEGLAAAICNADGCTQLVTAARLKESAAPAADGPTQPQPETPPNRERDAGDVLRDALATYYDRREVYGVAHVKYGNVMAALFPEGLTLKTSEDHQLFHMVGHIAGKLTRFAGSGLKDHDSVLDISTYAALAHVLVNGANIETGSKS